ncbi:MAG: sigma-70 family RNA polymerase sigma factor [Pirellulales bacterium]|nr:sigma-70 family RNA polymerase sigma factor [Pirellulales bacterium]
MALSETDRQLLTRCLTKQPKAWEDFVDRYLGLIVHVINHAAQSRSVRISPPDREDLAADVLVQLVRDDFLVLRNFRGESSLAAYLTVIARRVVVAKLLKRVAEPTLGHAAEQHAGNGHASEDWLQNRDEVERLLSELEQSEAQLVKLYHLEGKTYAEISSATGMAENSIGPSLSRAREKLRRAAVKH